MSVDDVAFVGVQGVEQADGERAAGAHAGAGGDVADGGDLQMRAEVEVAERFADDGVLNVVDALADFRFAIGHAGGSLEAVAERDVHVLVDGDAEDRAEFLLIKRRQIGAAAGEADAIGCLGDDHSRTPAGIVCGGQQWSRDCF